MKTPVLIACLALLTGCGGSTAEPSIPPPPPMPERSPSFEMAEPAPEPQPEPAPAGNYDPCAGKACGEMCRICNPDDPDCMETMVVKQCNAAGVCTHEPPDCPDAS